MDVKGRCDICHFWAASYVFDLQKPVFGMPLSILVCGSGAMMAKRGEPIKVSSCVLKAQERGYDWHRQEAQTV